MKGGITTPGLLQLAGVIVFWLLIPLLAGAWLDRQFDTAPWVTLAGGVVGIFLATRSVVRMLGAAFKSATTDSRVDKEDE